MLNQVIEATLAFMILLLALSVTAIIRVGPTAPASSESNMDSDTAMPQSHPQSQPIRVMVGAQQGQMAPAAAPMMWTAPAPGSMLQAVPPPPRKPGLLGRGRYEARHVRGRMPRPRPPAPAGPPWGPATPPPSRPQQGSERWT